MNREISTCKECGSEYYTDTSNRAHICPNCSHYLYGDNRCYHRFDSGDRCSKCYWNGNVSTRITEMIKRNDKKLKNINVSIIVGMIVLIISLPLTILGIIYFDTTVLSLAEYSFSRNVLFFLSVFGVIVSIPFLIKAKAHKKRLISEIPYLNH